MWCYSLIDIEIVDTVTTIGKGAFSDCSFTEFTISDKITSVGSGAFTRCSNLSTIIVDPNNTVYDSRNNCNAIVETATNTLIQGCKNTVIPNDVTSIGDFAFEGCELSTINIPSSVTSIGIWAFESSSLTSIVIPSSVTNIGEKAFQRCSSLASVTLPDNVTVGFAGFANCTALTRVNSNVEGECILPNYITTDAGAGSAFSRCESLTSLIIPSTITTIGSNCFYKCTGLTNVTINNGVENIANYVFYYCSNLTSITIPSSVTTIGSYTFSGCSGLTSVTCLAVTPPTLDKYGAFNNTNNCPIYVPTTSVNDYKTASGWSDYANRIQAIPTA